MSLTTPRLALFAAVLLAIAMVCALGWQGYSFWRHEQQATTQTTPAVISRQNRQANAVNLANLDLFGRVTNTPTPTQQTENLPETNLRIFLRGVMAADGEYPASALIEGSDGKTEVYVVGDEIPGNASLRSVFPNRVVLDRSGKLENLYFPETNDDTGVSLEANNPPVEPSSDSTNTDSPTPSVMPSPASADERREQIRQRLEQLRERLKANSN